MKRIVCNVDKKSVVEILRDIPDDVYRNLDRVEKKVIAKACNSKDPQIYLQGALEGMELAGFQFSNQFDDIYQDFVKNFDFEQYR
mgnify:CR=1 FL=1